MPATPSQIAAYTTNGVLITRNDPAIKAAHVNAKDMGTGEIEMFCDNAADAYVLLQERFVLLSLVGRVHEAVEIDDSLGLGTTLPVTGAVPQFVLVDEDRNMNTRATIRAYSFDMSTDRYAVEFAGIVGTSDAAWTADTTEVTADSTSRTADEL